MTIASIALKPASVVSSDTALLDVARLMARDEVCHAPVSDGGRYVGMVDVGDIFGVLAPKGLHDLKFAGDMLGVIRQHVQELATHKVKEIMVRDIPALPENCPFAEALLLLSKHDRPLAVVDAVGQVKGMLSNHGLLAYLLQEEGK